MVGALRKVMASIPNTNGKNEGRALAYNILAAKGFTNKVRDLKPALYDTVVAACEEALKPKPKAAPAAALESEDDLGGDPPEQTGGGIDAESSGEDM